MATDMVSAGSFARGIPGQTAPGGPRASVPALSRGRLFPIWPLFLLALPAFVAIWAGWVGLGGLSGFGPVNLLPGIGKGWRINSAITLPIGVETYAAYALKAWLSRGVPRRARTFAMWSAIASLAVGALGQVTYHLLAAGKAPAQLAKMHAPWPVTMAVACLPVAVLGMGAALAHLIRDGQDEAEEQPQRWSLVAGRVSDLAQRFRALAGQPAEAETSTVPDTPAELTRPERLPEAPVSPAPLFLPPELPESREGKWAIIERIRAAHPGISQSDAGGMVGVSARTVRNWMPEGLVWS